MKRTRRASIAFSLIIGLLSLLVPVHTGAQATSAAPKRSRNRARPAAKKPSPSPLTVVPLTAFASGDNRIEFSGQMKPLVHLGLALNGVTIVEFPATDHIFAWHQGSAEMVHIECRPTGPAGKCDRTDRYMVLRAGESLLAPALLSGKNGPKDLGKIPATDISVQMNSGLILTFLIYPARSLTEKTHRLVISYDVREVVENRKRLNLAVNLEGVQPELPKTTQVAETTMKPPLVSPGVPSDRASRSGIIKNPIKPGELAPAISDLPSAIAELDRRPKKFDGGVTEPAQVAKRALEQAVKDAKKFKNWTTPVHGLSLSLFSREINATSRLVVVAVRNTQKDPVQLMPGHPEIYVETMGDKNTRLQIELLKKLHTASTTTGSVLPVGAVVYYALVYDTPMLTTKQHLRVAVGQINAIDQPASGELSSR